MFDSLRDGRAAAPLALLLLAAGCSPKPTFSELRGKVTLDGKPVSAHAVLFAGADRTVTIRLTKDGEFHTPMGPLGKAGVYFTSIPADDDRPETSDAPASRDEFLKSGRSVPTKPRPATKLPEKYCVPDKPQIEVDLKPGVNEFAFELKS